MSGHGHGGHGHSDDPFDKRVAMTMAIVAAFLAFVTMLSHNAHNDTLLLQGEANRLQTESNIYHTQASDAWGYFQAKNIRSYQTHAYAGLYDALNHPLPPPAAKGKKEPPPPAAPPAILTEWQAQYKKYETELPKLQADAEGLVKKAEQAAEASRAKLEDSHHAHHKGARFDLAELAIELALILCSLAVLSKRAPFLYAGIGSVLVGLGLTVTAFLMH